MSVKPKLPYEVNSRPIRAQGRSTRKENQILPSDDGKDASRYAITSAGKPPSATSSTSWRLVAHKYLFHAAPIFSVFSQTCPTSTSNSKACHKKLIQYIYPSFLWAPSRSAPPLRAPPHQSRGPTPVCSSQQVSRE